MASIDKTYVNKTELLEAINWCKNIGEVTLENGYKFYPLNFILSYNDIDNIEDKNHYTLWCTPSWFDRWLWLNCPLSFIKDRIESVYSKDFLKYFENWKYEEKLPEKRKYTFIETPSGNKWKFIAKGKGKKKSIYIFEIYNGEECLGYNYQVDKWGEKFDMLPYYHNFELVNKVLNKKTIMRILKKWYIPSNSIVKIKNLHYCGMDYKILVK